MNVLRSKPKLSTPKAIVRFFVDSLLRIATRDHVLRNKMSTASVGAAEAKNRIPKDSVSWEEGRREERTDGGRLPGLGRETQLI